MARWIIFSTDQVFFGKLGNVDPRNVYEKARGSSGGTDRGIGTEPEPMVGVRRHGGRDRGRGRGQAGQRVPAVAIRCTVFIIYYSASVEVAAVAYTVRSSGSGPLSELSIAAQSPPGTYSITRHRCFCTHTHTHTLESTRTPRKQLLVCLISIE